MTLSTWTRPAWTSDYPLPGVAGPARLLLASCRPRDAVAAGGLEAEAPFDWPELLRLASHHKVIPALSRALQKSPNLPVPAEVRAQLRDYASGHARRNLVLTQELLRILDIFDAGNVPAIPVKGPVWAVALHGDLTLRQFSDLDVLIDPADAANAKALLLAQGYEQTKVQLSLVYKSADLVSADGVVKLDLQWGLATRQMNARFSFPGLAGRQQMVKVLNRQVPHLSAEDLLHILCFYCAKDLPWVSLSYIRDIAAVLARHQRIDWNAAIEQAAELGMLHIFLFGLFLADRLLSLPLPDQVRARFRGQSFLAPLASRVVQRMLVDLDRRHHEFPTTAERFEAARYHFRVRERLLDKLRPMIYLPAFFEVARPMRQAGNRLARMIQAAAGPTQNRG